MEKRKQICKATVKGMGYTDAMIKHLLPEPERVRNPRYRKASDMCLWYEDDVLAVMETEAFALAKAEAEIRAAAGRMAAERKAAARKAAKVAEERRWDEYRVRREAFCSEHQKQGMALMATAQQCRSIVVDVETTGLSYLYDEILQVSIIDAADGSELLSSYVKPLFAKAWPEAQAINGITPEMVADAPTIEDLWEPIQRIVLSAELIIAYNGGFDESFLRQAGVYFPAETPRYDVMYEFAPVYGDWSDYHGDYKWQALVVAAGYYGYTFAAHDSLADCRATLHVYNALRAREREIAAIPEERKAWMQQCFDAEEQAQCGDNSYEWRKTLTTLEAEIVLSWDRERDYYERNNSDFDY